MQKHLLITLILQFLIIFSCTSNLVKAQSDGESTTEEEDEQNDKIVIDFYIESLCPFSQSLFDNSGSIKQALDIEGLENMWDFNLFPFGNAVQRTTDDKFYISCQHGPQECYGNLMQQCAIEFFEKDLAMTFIQCLFNYGSPKFDEAATVCQRLHPDVDLNKIYACIDNPRVSQELQERYAKLSKKVQYTPYITVNGKHNKQYEDDIVSNLVKFICEHYEGDYELDACSDESILNAKHFSVTKYFKNHKCKK